MSNIVPKVRKVYKKRYNKKASNQVVGHGDYKTVLRKLNHLAKAVISEPKGPIGRLGQMAGTVMGMGTLGRLAGNIIGKLTGTGAYLHNADKIRYNSLFNRTNDGVQIPSFGETDRSTRICHREYIGDLISGPTGAPTLFDTWENVGVNPGLLDSFAWLSQIAQNYDTYKFNGIVYEFKSMSGSATGANTQLGNIIFSAQYNSTNLPFTNKLQMENYQGACSCNPSENMLFGIECDPKDLPLDHLYVRSGQVRNNQSKQFYDLCSLQIATQGVPTANQILGEIWVTYDVDLYQPKLYSGQVGNNILSAGFTSTGGALNLGAANSAFIGMTPIGGNSLAVTLSYDAFGNGIITLSENLVTGNYLMTWSVNGAAAVNQLGTVTLVNADPFNIFGAPGAGTNQRSSANGAMANFIWEYAFTINNDNARPVQLQLNYPTFVTPTPVNTADLFITQISGQLEAVV